MRQFLPLRQYFSFTLLATVCCLQACSNTSDEVKASSDFATADIRAEYSVIVRPASGGFSYQMEARFKNGDNNLQLDGGDSVSAVDDGDSYSLKEEKVLNSVVYARNKVFSSSDKPVALTFALKRNEKTDATASVVEIPDSIRDVSPRSGNVIALNPAGELLVQWQGLTNPDKELKLSILQTYICKDDAGTTLVNRGMLLTTTDDGQEAINVKKAVNNSSVSSCDMSLTLSRKKSGNLDDKLAGGTAEGIFITEIKNIRVENF